MFFILTYRLVNKAFVLFRRTQVAEEQYRLSWRLGRVTLLISVCIEELVNIAF